MRTTATTASRSCAGLVLSCVFVLMLALPLRTATGDTREVALMRSGAGLMPSQWGALLTAGHYDKANYDYATEDIAQRLQRIGVHNVIRLTATRQYAQGTGAMLATHEGIRAAFARIVDAQTGACLFFISSHANRRGIYLALERGDQYLTARELDQYFTQACPGRPQVLILSGCHSGAMITSAMTQHPQRIVLASASPTTVSYGATTTERHLNFERCLIKAYDAGAVTWREMFEKALPCVAEREDWLRVPASKPDAYFGSYVADLRIPGR